MNPRLLVAKMRLSQGPVSQELAQREGTPLSPEQPRHQGAEVQALGVPGVPGITGWASPCAGVAPASSLGQLEVPAKDAMLAGC